MKKKGISNRKASTSVGGTQSRSKEIHIPQLVDKREHTPPPGFADQEQGLQMGIVLPPACGVSLRTLTDDLVLPTLSIGGPITMTSHSDWIAGICHSIPKKNTGLIHIDLTEDGCETATETAVRRGPLTKGGGSLGVARKGPLTVRGGAAMGGTARGGAVRSGAIRGGANRGGANASSSSNQLKGKHIVTTIEKRTEIMEAKRKRKNPDLKP
jgi:hypothetical protein